MKPDKVLEPTAASRIEDVWNTLSDRQRSEMIERITELALKRLQELARKHRTPGIPEGWYIRNWEARGGGNPLAAFTVAVKELHSA
jgi:hypothetical protein